MLSLMSSKLVLAATCALAALNGASARSFDVFSRTNGGINCDGSSFCAGHGGALNEILRVANTFQPGLFIGAGEQFACKQISGWPSGICAYTDSDITLGPSTNGQANSLADVVQDLISHGCDPCGSAPIVRTGNDLSKGAITVNYKKRI